MKNVFKSILRWIAMVGPGLFCLGFTIGTGSVTSMVKSGSMFGTGLLWALAISAFFTWVMTYAYGHFGIVTGDTAIHGIKHNLCGGRVWAIILIAGLVVSQWISLSSILNITSNAVAEVLYLCIPGLPSAASYWIVLAMAVLIAGSVWAVLNRGNYGVFEKILSVLVTLMGLAFIISMFIELPAPGTIIRGFVPRIPDSADARLFIAAFVGTTMSSPTFVIRPMIIKSKGWGRADGRLQRRDATVSAALTFIISASIMICAAGVLHTRGIRVEKVLDMIYVLQPIAGRFAVALFVVGLLSAGLSSLFPIMMLAPELISDYRNGEMQTGTPLFKVLTGVAALAGLTIPILGTSPVITQIASQVTLVFVLPLVILLMMIMINKRSVMGSLKPGPFFNVLMGLALVFACIVSCTGVIALGKLPKQSKPAYLDTSRPLEERVEDALSRMTMEEKVAMTHAQSKFSSAGVPRLGIPEVWHTDGPHGIRPEVMWDEWYQAGWTNDSCTAYPALVNLAATWDRSLSGLYGSCIGAEARYRKKDILLGPGVNMGRTPLNGRTFEYMGEDPYLASAMVVPYVKGVQSNGVAACVKHFAVNNQEVRRTSTSSNVDDRTMYEIYLPAFKAAVQEGGAWAIMGSYNLWNGQYNCHNKRLLQDILKDEWGFDGVVVSDWGGCRDDDEAASNGLDIEMGTWVDDILEDEGASNAYDRYHLANPYLERLRDGRASQKDLDDKARRILRTIFRTSMSKDRPYGSFTSPEHFAAARKIAAEGIVLLKNDGALPLDVPDGGKILLVGENAYKMMTVGGGSSSLKTKYEVIPLDAIREAFEGKADVDWVRGYVGDVTTDYNKVVTGQDLSESRSADELRAEALAAAREADCVIFIGGLNKSRHQDKEGTDRKDIVLPYGQDELIEALAGVSKKLVVVNISGSPVAMPWADKVNAVVQSWYGGSESGHALADVLTGAVNPSGKLPFTIPYALADGPLKTERQYPGIRVDGVPYWEEYYDEGVFIGYRWYSSKDIPVQFPFGYGLSYTGFELSGAKLSASAVRAGKDVKASVTVTNTGSVAGAEVVQLYVNDVKASVERPVRELKGFNKVYLEPGQSRKLTFTLTPQDLSFFDAESHSWKLEPGEFHILIGTSSENLPVDLAFNVR